MKLFGLIVAACAMLFATQASAGRYVTISGQGSISFPGFGCLPSSGLCSSSGLVENFVFETIIDSSLVPADGFSDQLVDERGNNYYLDGTPSSFSVYYTSLSYLRMLTIDYARPTTNARTTHDLCNRACYSLSYNLFTRATSSDTRPATLGLTYDESLGLVAVPEPATWAMLLIGFGGMGMTMRRSAGSRVRRTRPRLRYA